MKLIFSIPHLAVGGAERVVSLLANRLVEEGNDVTIVLLSKNEHSYPLVKGVKLFFSGDNGRNSLWKRIVWFRHFVKEQQCDIVISFLEKAYCMTILSLFGMNIPIVSSERNDPRFTKPWFMKIARKCFLVYTTKLVVQTQRIKEYFPSYIQKKTIITKVSQVMAHLHNLT